MFNKIKNNPNAVRLTESELKRMSGGTAASAFDYCGYCENGPCSRDPRDDFSCFCSAGGSRSSC